MSEADRRRQEEEPESLLDVVEGEYPERVGGLFGGLSQIGKLFTAEDWISILTRSRSAFERGWRDKGR
ncbi:MAG: hypothetical protein LBK98_02020 [Peptococcaceae bacterium]|jgi:hypothetical protein|nr:hypothetical protein [Peptococcaceae bacterium]